MPRLKLKPKKPQLRIKPKIEKGMKIGRTIVESPVINHDDSAFPFLEFFDPMTLKVSRVDRYSINLFHSPRKREDGIMMYDTELIFYPSGPGMEQIESFANDDTIITNTGLAQRLIGRLDQLKIYGNPWWHVDVDFPVTYENWLSVNPEKVPPETPKRIKLKSKSKRPTLKPKVENNNKRMKLKVSS